MNGYHLLLGLILFIFAGRILLFLLNATIELYLLKEKLTPGQIQWLININSEHKKPVKDLSPALNIKLALNILRVKKLRMITRLQEKYGEIIILTSREK